MTIVISIMIIVLRMKTIARCSKNSFITLPDEEYQAEKFIKSLKTALHESLADIIQRNRMYTGMKLGCNFKIKHGSI